MACKPQTTLFSQRAGEGWIKRWRMMNKPSVHPQQPPSSLGNLQGPSGQLLKGGIFLDCTLAVTTSNKWWEIEGVVHAYCHTINYFT